MSVYPHIYQRLTHSPIWRMESLIMISNKKLNFNRTYIPCKHIHLTMFSGIVFFIGEWDVSKRINMKEDTWCDTYIILYIVSIYIYVAHSMPSFIWFGTFDSESLGEHATLGRNSTGIYKKIHNSLHIIPVSQQVIHSIRQWLITCLIVICVLHILI